VLILDEATDAFAGSVELDGTPFGIAVDPRGRAVYATTPGTGTLWVIDGPSARVTRKLSVGVAPYGVSVHPQNGRVYVADAYANRVYVVDAAAGTVVAEIGVGVSPVAFGAFIGPVADEVAVEYYHGAYDHYFVTAGKDEIALLDAGAFTGWVRSGQSFRVRPSGTAGAAAVCRFWSGGTFAPKSSHFYTPFDWECAKVRGDPSWSFEGTRFALNLPEPAGGCAPGRVPLYRLYNDGSSGAPNHRYTTSAIIRATMIAQGWIAEGYGSLGVIGCVQSP
jgi:YVTN family beta-propeller protein